MHQMRNDCRYNPHESQCWAEIRSKLTKVGDPDGDPLIEGIEDHNYNEANDGGCDRSSHLRRHVLL